MCKRPGASGRILSLPHHTLDSENFSESQLAQAQSTLRLYEVQIWSHYPQNLGLVLSAGRTMRGGVSARGEGGRADARVTDPPARTPTTPPHARSSRTEHRVPAAVPAMRDSGFGVRDSGFGVRNSDWHACLIRQSAPEDLLRA